MSSRTLSLSLLCLVGLLLGGCASSGGNRTSARRGTDEPLRVTVHMYDAGSQLELVGESSMSAVDLYSEARATASSKVQGDEVMEALAKQLGKQGFQRYAREGRAPSVGGRVYTRSIEIWRAGDSSHWAVGPGSADDERRAFNSCLADFLQLYNVTASYQTIENEDGKAFFQQPNVGSGNRRLQ
jgi:hypothetical protein